MVLGRPAESRKRERTKGSFPGKNQIRETDKRKIIGLVSVTPALWKLKARGLPGV